MDMLRRNLFLIVTALVGVGGIALGYTGLQAMPKVVDEMNRAKGLYDELGGLSSKPVNRGGIDREQQRINSTQQDLARITNKAKSLRTYEPLVPDVFPNGDDDARRRFQKSYGEAMDRLFDSLKWGQPALPADVKVWESKIANEKYQAQVKGLDAGTFEPSSAVVGPARTGAGVLTVDGARTDAKARANMAVAQKSYCYAVPRSSTVRNKVSSLDFHSEMVSTGTVDAPEIDAVWRAQIGYWVQKEVVDAIVAVNQEAAAKARERGEDRWIGNMPVKDVISIRMSEDYVVAEAGEFAGAPAGGYAEAMPPTTGETVFTGSVSGERYEVLQFTVKLVMDQRDIPQLIDKITTNSFHVLLRAAYKVVPPNVDMVGKIYGSEPNVNVVMDFESIMLGELFRPMMPTVVCELLSEQGSEIECPELEEDLEEEG